MHFPLFIAKRLYSEQGDKRKVSRPAIHIATAGVAIGLAVMIISVCVVLGFKHTIRDKVIGFGSHIQVADFLTLQQMEQYPIVIDDSMIDVLKHIPDVAHVQRFAMKEESSRPTATSWAWHSREWVPSSTPPSSTTTWWREAFLISPTA